MKVSGFFHRFLCCLLVALLLIPAALADSVDLSSMSDTEIVALLEQVNQEIVTRGINKTAKLPQGAYTAMTGEILLSNQMAVKENCSFGRLSPLLKAEPIREQYSSP